ncbi:IS21 family transposase [Edaphobacter aggregans]|uniref:IS21 family transposase n=1 Tax=Edaphobacter aggregans TaxID=570835 RepID=UPI00068FC80F|nr:IS21 family transposase [Edaphobacter aggregans]
MTSGENREIAASKAGMDAKTARKYRRLGKMPSELSLAVRGRTRPDPFVDVWDEVQELFRANPGLEAKTVFEYLQRQYPGRFQDGQLRTLQRRVKGWRATDGPAREVFFVQQHPPGRLGASDFTHMEELGVTIAGQSYPHLIYHFVLTYSNWEAGTVCYSESFESLSEGLQNALWKLGRVPQRHRTDRLSTAVNNTSNPAEFTDRYTGLMRYYGLESEKTQAGHGNENGDVEQRHHRFKRAVAQELMLRGSLDFRSVDEYRGFLDAMFERLNAGRRQRLAEEMAVMRELPERRMESAKRERVKVDSGSLIYADRNVYSVPSRLIGEQVEVRLHMDHVEVWYGQKKVEQMPRLRGRRKHRVDYRHIIDWLVRKPGAFEHYRYRDELFPTSRFRMAFDLLQEQLGRSHGSKEYLRILELAAKDGEVRVDAALRAMLETGDAQISAKGIEAMLETEHSTVVRDVQVAAVDLRLFDQLFGAREVLQ